VKKRAICKKSTKFIEYKMNVCAALPGYHNPVQMLRTSVYMISPILVIAFFLLPVEF